MAQDYSQQREWIASCVDPNKLRRFMANAKARGVDELYDLARRRLFNILPEAEEGTFEHDVWRSIHALEDVRTQEAGKTIRLSRTRQTIGRKGVRQTVNDFVSKKSVTEGLKMLQDRNMLEYSFEAVVLRHPNEFCPSVRMAARSRLEEIGYL